MVGPHVSFQLPPASLFTLPPHHEPRTLPAPAATGTLATPFRIDPVWYQRLLDVKIPLSVSCLYIVAVLTLNALNRQRANRPWALSKSRAFFAFVLAHNLMLAAFSALTFVAMSRAFQHTWPGLHTSRGLAGAVDSMCKIHGPRGLGDAASWNMTGGHWEVHNDRILMSAEGSPDSTDVGRLWNEGLAFWGWFFYLSKFYELLDTAIILAKGKQSSILQTYHHTGAMFCMWAGIRYMSPPIWMFVAINSGIHTLMYIYYALSMGVRVPQAFKGILTSMQISQFVFGALYAAGHLFISYSIPVTVPYVYVRTITAAAAAASSVASSALSAASSAAVSGGLTGYIKKIAYRAAGEEGLAENVHTQHVHASAPTVAKPLEESIRLTRYRESWRSVPCVDTSGQAFAIYLNVLYLAPLTYLFIRFFVRSYLRGASGSTMKGSRYSRITKASDDAAKLIDRKFDAIGQSVTDTATAIPGQVKKSAMAVRDSGAAQVHRVEQQLHNSSTYAVENAKMAGGVLREKVHATVETASNLNQEASARAKAAAKRVERNTAEQAKVVASQLERAENYAAEHARDLANELASPVEQVKATLKDGVKKAVDAASPAANVISQVAAKAANSTMKNAKSALEQTKTTIGASKSAALAIGQESAKKASDATEALSSSTSHVAQQAVKAKDAIQRKVERELDEAQRGAAGEKGAASNTESNIVDDSIEEDDDAEEYKGSKAQRHPWVPEPQKTESESKTNGESRASSQRRRRREKKHAAHQDGEGNNAHSTSQAASHTPGGHENIAAARTHDHDENDKLEKESGDEHEEDVDNSWMHDVSAKSADVEDAPIDILKRVNT